MEEEGVTWLGEMKIPEVWGQDYIKGETVEIEVKEEMLQTKGREEDDNTKGVCPSCFKKVGNVRRHERENCRSKKDKMTVCNFCSSAIFKSRYKEHLRKGLQKNHIFAYDFVLNSC